MRVRILILVAVLLAAGWLSLINMGKVPAPESLLQLKAKVRGTK